MPDRVFLAHSFNFRVKLFLAQLKPEGAPDAPNQAGGPQQLVDGAFQECSGLDVEMDVQEYQEGGRNDGVIKRVGRAKYQPLVLKRGMFYRVPEHKQRTNEKVDSQLWVWFQHVVEGRRPVARYDGLVEVLDKVTDTDPVARWAFDRGLPAKIVGPQLNAKTGEVAIEELHIAHEGLRLVP